MKYKNRYRLVWIISVFFFFGSESHSSSTSLGDWTGEHTRLVWVQDQGKGADTFARSNKLMLYGYDSKDGRGERPLVPGVGNFFKPLFTPDGKHVVVSNRNKRQMYLVEWESGKVEKLGPGVAVAVWVDPKPSFLLRKKKVWVYCFQGLQPENKYGTSQPLYRFALDNPKKKELIWKNTNMAWSSLQVSRDGELLGGLFPWPHGGVLNTRTNEFQRVGRGCWTSLSPDNSKLLWIFDGLHRNIQIYDIEGKTDWTVNINNAPGINGFEVYHPRWSNHPRYFVMTGPYEKGEGGNKIGGGGETVEVHVGRFGNDAKSVENWFQVTHNSRADFYPELWVAGGDKAELRDTFAAADKPKSSVKWPVATKNLLFVWENMKASNQLDTKGPLGFYQCNLELRGRALHSKDYQLIATGGWGETAEAGEKIAAALSASEKVSIEATIIADQAQSAFVYSFKNSEKTVLGLQQREEDLILFFPENGDQTATVAWEKVLVAGKPTTVVITLDDQSAELFVDGRSRGKNSVKADFKAIDFDRFVLGDSTVAWRGSLENIAVYNRILNSRVMEQNLRLVQDKLRGRNPLAKLTVDGALLERTEVPAPDAIGAYRRALVVNSYVVKNVVDGDYSNDRILVAEWAVLDREIVKEYQESALSERLVLERFDQHPELEGERQMMDVFEPDLDMYYRIPTEIWHN